MATSTSTPRPRLRDIDGTTPCMRSPHPDWWYSEVREEKEAAKRVCLTCPVIATCFDNAVVADEHHGVWGGVNFTDKWSPHQKSRKAELVAEYIDRLAAAS